VKPKTDELLDTALAICAGVGRLVELFLLIVLGGFLCFWNLLHPSEWRREWRRLHCLATKPRAPVVQLHQHRRK
jgi:hypothetical protein